MLSTTQRTGIILVLLTVFITYLWTVFSTLPFIQQEVLGMAFFWNYPGYSFLETFFDPLKTDGYAGRFRYIEYLSEAIYWKLMNAGFLPRHIYDYFALLNTALMSGLIFLICRFKKIDLGPSLLITTFFLLSVPSFMIAVFHFRKAKYLVSLLLLLIVFISHCRFDSEKQKSQIIVALSILGFFTDPYFIILSPFLMLTLDFVDKNRLFHFRSLFRGFIFAGIFLFILSGILGPLFNIKARLPFPPLPKIPEEIFKIANTRFTLQLIPDFLYPGFQSPTGNLSTVIFLFLAVAAIGFYYRNQLSSFFILFLVLLPVFAFILVPNSQQFRFAGYYGHPLFVFFILAIIGIFEKTKESKFSQSVLSIVVLALIGIHQMGKEQVFLSWRERHFTTHDTEKKFSKDLAELLEIRQYLHKEITTPYQLNLDLTNLVEFSFRDVYEKGETHLHRNRSYLSYFLFPIVFHQEIESGKIEVHVQ